MIGKSAVKRQGKEHMLQVYHVTHVLVEYSKE